MQTCSYPACQDTLFRAGLVPFLVPWTTLALGMHLVSSQNNVITYLKYNSIKIPFYWNTVIKVLKYCYRNRCQCCIQYLDLTTHLLNNFNLKVVMTAKLQRDPKIPVRASSQKLPILLCLVVYIPNGREC